MKNGGRRRFLRQLAATPLAAAGAPAAGRTPVAQAADLERKRRRFGEALARYWEAERHLRQALAERQGRLGALSAAWSDSFDRLVAVPPATTADLLQLGRVAMGYLQPMDDPADPLARTLARLVAGQEELLGGD